MGGGCGSGGFVRLLSPPDVNGGSIESMWLSSRGGQVLESDRERTRGEPGSWADCLSDCRCLLISELYTTKVELETGF